MLISASCEPKIWTTSILLTTLRCNAKEWQTKLKIVRLNLKTPCVVSTKTVRHISRPFGFKRFGWSSCNNNRLSSGSHPSERVGCVNNRLSSDNSTNFSYKCNISSSCSSTKTKWTISTRKCWFSNTQSTLYRSSWRKRNCKNNKN